MEKELNGSNHRIALIQGGFSSEQASIYELLVQNGPLPASTAARLANISRPLGYKVLGELEEIGLVEKKEAPGKVAIFIAAHPLKLKEIADKKFESAKNAKVALEGTLSKLISDFNTIAGQPGVRILEGVAGVAELYEDQLNERQPILLIRSPKDDIFPELAAMVQKQIKDQVALGMKVRVIAPLTRGTPYKIISLDKERLVERRIVPAEEFSIPAQVVIYGNKVAITAYDEILMTTIIENPAINQTFKIIFEYLWKLAKDDHERIMKTIISS